MPQAAKRISIVVPSLALGGAQRVSVNLANRMAELGYLVDVVCVYSGGPLVKDVSADCRLVPLHVGRLRYSVIPLLRYFWQARPDGVIANIWPVTAITAVTQRIAAPRARLLVVEHSTMSLELARTGELGLYILVASCLYRLSDYVISISHGCEEDLRATLRLSARKFKMIYNPVVKSRAENSPVLAADGEEKEFKKILAVGNLQYHKDYPTLLRAFRSVRNKVKAHLYIVGEGSLRSELEALRKNLNLEQDVTLNGAVANPETFYRSADLMVLSSVQEGLPTVLIEALSYGLPIVSTDCRSGPREILSNGEFGQLVPPGNSELLSEAILHTLNSAVDSDKQRRRAHSFGIDISTDKYIQLLFPREEQAHGKAVSCRS
jgi:glycosyltransferase involved in cell wall biosynthesis